MKPAAFVVRRRTELSRWRLRALVATIAAVAATCLAGHWEFEQVDSGSLGSYVAIDKTSDGTIWLAYVNRDFAIRLAHKDSVWKYEDLDTALVRPMSPTDYLFDDLPFSFDIGPNDIMGVVGLGRLAERRDTVWSSEALPMPMNGLSLSYDPAGRPSLTFKDSLWQGCLGLKTDSGWDTSIAFHPTEYTWSYTLSRPAWRRDGGCAFMEADVWLMGIVIEGYGVRLYVRDSSAWTAHAVADGYDGSGSGLAALVDSSDSIHTFWSATDNDSADYLVFDTTVLDSFTRVATACMDDSGRVQCAWARHGRLKFALVPEPTIEVESVGGVDWCDLTTDKLAEPVIAFSRSDGAIWLARGVGIAGLSDEPRGTVVHLLGPRTSIVKGVLFLPKMGTVPSGTVPHFRPSLLDACGRCVMDLRPGANDVSRLAPGVYFVRGPETEDGRPATDVQRVVVVK